MNDTIRGNTTYTKAQKIQQCEDILTELHPVGYEACKTPGIMTSTPLFSLLSLSMARALLQFPNSMGIF